MRFSAIFFLCMGFVTSSVDAASGLNQPNLSSIPPTGYRQSSQAGVYVSSDGKWFQTYQAATNTWVPCDAHGVALVNASDSLPQTQGRDFEISKITAGPNGDITTHSAATISLHE
jgi:hypothetical protein